MDDEASAIDADQHRFCNQVRQGLSALTDLRCRCSSCTRYSVSSNVEERMLGCIKRPESFAKGRVDSVVIVTSRPHHRKLELKAQIDALASYCTESAALSERSTDRTS